MNAGSTISHYRIVDRLGRGGMGIVYTAEDTKLDRIVALKVLPTQALASEDDRARFCREAKAAAALHHPNIATIFGIDEATIEESDESQQFIAMEYVEWNRQGVEVFYADPNGNLMVVPVDISGEQQVIGRAEALFNATQFGHRLINGFHNSFYYPRSDGQAFAIVRLQSSGGAPAITVVENWFSEFDEK